MFFLKKKIIKPKVVFTDHFINQTVMANFAKGIGADRVYPIHSFKDYDLPIASYGYLRGAGELYKKCDFWYIDHGYFKQSQRSFQDNKVLVNNLDGYFRIVHNDFWHNGIKKFSSDRFEKLNLEISPQKSTGSYIIVSEPTEDASNYYDLQNWTNNTVEELKKYTDRKIILHNRNSKVPLDELLKNAWAFVSDHSSAGFKAMLKGVPAFYTNKTLKEVGDIRNIEKHKINEKIISNLAYCQWTLAEIASGEAWHFISRELY